MSDEKAGKLRLSTSLALVVINVLRYSDLVNLYKFDVVKIILFT